RLVAVQPPLVKQTASRLVNVGLGDAIHSHDRHRPFDDAEPNARQPGIDEGAIGLRRLHREYMAAALEVIVAKNGTADDRQVGVGADEVMRELLYEIKQSRK